MNCHEHNSHEHDHDHDKHAGHNPEMFRQKFWLSFLLSIPVVLYSDMIQRWFGFDMPGFPGSDYLPAILGTIIFFYGGLVFIKSALAEIKQRQPGMMTLIAIAITVAFSYSLAVTLGWPGEDFFWELATLVTIMLFGHWIEMRSIQSAQGALDELAKLLPDEAELIEGDDIRSVPVDQLSEDDLLLVRPGASVPIDGEVVDGSSSVNEAMITGESEPIKKTIGSEVIGGTINGHGALRIRVTHTQESTMLAGIMRLVSEAQQSKSRSQLLADRAAFYLTYVALSVAVITFVAWLLFSGESGNFALERTVTVLIIACPHALGLAIPLVTSISTTLAARNGLLVRERKALESARNIDTVVFDKTGTLTTGEQGLIDIWPLQGSSDELIALTAAVETNSEHPLAQAVINHAHQSDIPMPASSDFEALSGRGVQARVDGELVYVGGPQLLNELDITPDESLQKQTRQAAKEGKTIIYTIRDGTIYGALSLADTIRAESYSAITNLQQNGVKVAMLTGDSEAVAAWVAAELGIGQHFAEVLPEHKSETIKQIQATGERVAMVGDGVNDAPALLQADIGIAIGAGTDVAIESAGIILASNDPRSITKIFTLSRASYRKMQQNLIWATGYNVLAIPLAAGVLAGYGILLAPAIGAVLMSLSTIIVAINAQFLRRLSFD